MRGGGLFESCLLTCTHLPTEASSSSSGLKFAEVDDLVLTHGSLLASILSLESVSKALGKLPLGRLVTIDEDNDSVSRSLFNSFLAQLKIDVTVWSSRQHEEVYSVTRQVRSTSSNLSGQIVAMFRSRLVTQTINSLLSTSAGWSFDDDEDDPQIRLLLPFFVVVQIHSPENSTCGSYRRVEDFLSRVWCSSEVALRGSPVHLEATPFGHLAPSIFLGTLSSGVVSALGGPSGIMLLCDASAAPGCEGAPLLRPGNRLAVGLVLSALSWRRGEWVGFTLAASLHPLLCEALHKVIPRNPDSNIMDGPEGVARASRGVILVRCGRSWGSGVVWPTPESSGTNDLVIVTCAHVVRDAGPHQSVTIVSSGGERVGAKLVFRSAEGKVFDVAVLRCPQFKREKVVQHVLSTAPPRKGEEVYLVGHALFEEGWSISACVSRGVISSVPSAGLLISSCCVQGGASGGALLRSSGQLVGIPVCVAHHSTTRALFPRINLAVPTQAIQRPIGEYLQNGDASVLSKLQGSDDLQRIWHLEDHDRGKLTIKAKL